MGLKLPITVAIVTSGAVLHRSLSLGLLLTDPGGLLRIGIAGSEIRGLSNIEHTDLLGPQVGVQVPLYDRAMPAGAHAKHIIVWSLTTDCGADQA